MMLPSPGLRVDPTVQTVLIGRCRLSREVDRSGCGAGRSSSASGCNATAASKLSTVRSRDCRGSWIDEDGVQLATQVPPGALKLRSPKLPVVPTAQSASIVHPHPPLRHLRRLRPVPRTRVGGGGGAGGAVWALCALCALCSPCPGGGTPVGFGFDARDGLRIAVCVVIGGPLRWRHCAVGCGRGHERGPVVGVGLPRSRSQCAVGCRHGN
jgi:hypothetical protein